MEKVTGTWALESGEVEQDFGAVARVAHPGSLS